MSKKLINEVKDCVDENLYGLIAVNDGLRLIPEHRVVFREDLELHKKQNRVTILSGGGAGHEPTFGGYVGPGMLSAAVSGSVFVSPPATNILAGIRLLGQNNNAGVLLIVANYTGDRLNFGQAAEMAKAEGIMVETVLVGEDCALSSIDKSAGRRGLSGIVLTMKIAGSMAEQGKSLSEIVPYLKNVIGNLGTIGLSLGACSLPGSGPNFSLKCDEMELGLGVHGEAGVARIKLQSAREAVTTMLGHMTNPDSATCLKLSRGQNVALLLNNLGGTSTLEMNIIAFEVIHWLENRGLKILRAYVGTCMTSLEMPGVTLTVLKIDNDEAIQYLDYDTEAPAWPKSLKSKKKVANRSSGCQVKAEDLFLTRIREKVMGPAISNESATIFQNLITESCKAIIENKDLLNALDSGCGDGDCGNTLCSGAEAILKELQNNALSTNRPYQALIKIAEICQQSMGGASGGIYSIFFTAAAAAIVQAKHIDIQDVAVMLTAGMDAISKYGGATVGDRTMLDSMFAAKETIDFVLKEGETNSKDIFVGASLAVHDAAEKTATMKAQAGRASYVNADLIKGPDAGAKAIDFIFKAIAKTL